MLKVSKIVLFVVFSFILIGCVDPEVPLPQHSNSSNGNFISNSLNDWATQTNVEEEENIDISDIDQELSETDMTTLENSSQKVERIPFPAKEYARLPRSGKGTIEGDVYLVDVYGDKVYGKNTRLYLNPITSYSNQWYKESYIKGQKMTEPDSRLFNYLRFTASDGTGHFAFYGVPSGSYYLIGTVSCGVECGYESPKNIRVATKVTVKGNQVVHKDLYRQISQ
jgi:hypothetical protein